MKREQREIQLWNDAVARCQEAFAEAIYEAEREAGDGLANPARQFIRAASKLYRHGDERTVVTGIDVSALPSLAGIVEVVGPTPQFAKDAASRFTLSPEASQFLLDTSPHSVSARIKAYVERSQGKDASE